MSLKTYTQGHPTMAIRPFHKVSEDGEADEKQVCRKFTNTLDNISTFTRAASSVNWNFPIKIINFGKLP